MKRQLLSLRYPDMQVDCWTETFNVRGTARVGWVLSSMLESWGYYYAWFNGFND